MNITSCFKEDIFAHYFLILQEFFNLQPFFLSIIFANFKYIYCFHMKKKLKFRSTPLFIKDIQTNKIDLWDIEEMKELVLLKSQINDIGFKTLISLRIITWLFILFGMIAVLNRLFLLASPIFLYTMGKKII